MNETYSEAARCARCAGRATLSRSAAERCVAVSAGRLVAFPCPERDGWHLANPVAEQARGHRDQPD